MEKKLFSFKDISIIIIASILQTLFVFLLAKANFFALMAEVFSFIVLLLNFLPPFLLTLFLYGVSGRVKIAIILSSLFELILLMVNRTKIIYRKDPFKITDVNLGLEAAKMAKDSYFPDKYSIFFSIIFIIIIGLIIFFYKSDRIKGLTRIFLIFLSIGLAYFSYESLYKPSDVFTSLKTYGNPFNEVDVFNSKGFNYCFIFKIRSSIIRPPESYDKETYISKEKLSRQKDIELLRLKEKPNIVWIMGEAFTDFSQNESFSFEKGKDPNENFKKIVDAAPMSGRIIVPGYGGGTGDTEFDVLTGSLTIDCAPDQSYAFNTIKRDTAALPSILRNLGYNTRGFHPGFEWFYHRNNVYPKLGFNEAYFLESIENPKNKGDYLSEEQFTDIYLGRLKKSLDKGELIFDYAVDIQNHGPYFYDKYGEIYPFSCKYDLTEDGTNVWGGYFIGVKDMDTMLGRVYDFINSREEPIIFVFYGDHLPSMGEDPDGFKQINLPMTTDTFNDEIQRYSTPYFVTANESGRKFLNPESLEYSKGEVISANFLSSSVLDMLGFTKADNYNIYNSRLRRQMPVISRHYIKYKDEAYDKTNLTDEMKEKYDEYKGYEYYKINERKRQ